MNPGLRRRVADVACRALQAMLPPSLQSWGLAVRRETSHIQDDTKALVHALESFCGLMPRAVAWHLFRPFASLTGDSAPFHGDSIIMHFYDTILSRPRVTGAACAIGAVTLGLVYMGLAGAPVRYLAVNVIALMIGLILMALLARTMRAGSQSTSAAIVAMGGALLATALLGSSVEGAARWVRLGGFSIQPSLILMPVMLGAFARCRNAFSTLGMIAAAIAMAMQPDRAMAGTLAAALAVLAIMRPDRYVVAAFSAAIAGFAVTLARPDTLPAVPYVDGILYSSFDVHALAGAAVLCGALLLLVPPIIGWYRDPSSRAAYATFGALWLAATVAAALGNYPTPLVGYGSSAIIGYALSLLALPTSAMLDGEATSQVHGHDEPAPLHRRLLAGRA